MANDVDMWHDIKNCKDIKMKKMLIECFEARFEEGDVEKAEKLKNEFIKEFGFWGNYY